jgi:hypothetical protein
MNEKILTGIRVCLIAALVGFGCWVYIQMKPYQFADNEISIRQPDAATDAVLRTLLRTYGDSPQLKSRAHPTQAMRQAIKELPNKDGILFVGNYKNPGHFALRLITEALAWPQPVYNPTCGDSIPGEMPPDNFKASGVIYYHTTPPAFITNQKMFLPEMIMTQAPEQTPWNSFCPQ